MRALLYRLAAEARPLSRSYLGYLFWADCLESTARQNLSRLLVYLTKALPAAGVIQADEGQVQLVSGRMSIDTCAFERYWESWKTNRQVQGLQAAAQLYRAPFLDGFYLPGNAEYGAWIQEQANYWEQRYLKTLDLLVRGLGACGDLALAIEYARRYLAHNNLAEDIHRRLIELYAASGDRSAALQQYEACATVLERELGVKPAQETVAAYLSALEQKPANAPAPPAWRILPSLQAPLIGRQTTMETIELLLEQAREGRGQVVFIGGEPGIGKTRLVQEFASRPRLRARLLIGWAARECCTIPYQPLVEALRPALGAPGLVQVVPAIWMAEAARLFPELAETVPQAPVLLSIEEARSRLFEALLRILLGFTENGYSLVLCLDDLQWADATTLDWLAYAGPRISTQRMLVIGTYREGEAESLAPLRASLGRLANYHELPLVGLTCKDTYRLCETLDETLVFDNRQVEHLCQTTGGNPFFLLETIREMLEAGRLPGQAFDPSNLPLPATVQAAIASRVERLRPQVQQVLEAASVLGLAFSFELVHQTSGRQELEILDGLDELVARQFLVEWAAGYQFCHAIIREAVYASLSYWRRRKLHERAGQALEKMNSSDWSGIAWHFEQAGESGKAARYALRAGQAAKAVFAHVEARAEFERALVLLDLEAGSINDAPTLDANRLTRIELLYERGWALRLLGDMEAYTRDLELVAQLAQASGDEQVLAHLRWREAYNHRWFCRYVEAQTAAQEGLRLCEKTGDRHLAALCRRELGMAARESGDYATAQCALEQALELFQSQAQDIVYTLHTLGNLSTLFCRQGETGRALELARQALELCERSTMPYERRLPLGDIGAALVAQCDFEQALVYLADSLAIAREITDRTQEIYCQGHLGWAFTGRGDYETGCQFFEAALRLAKQVGSLSEQSWLHAGLAQAYIGLEKQEFALAHAQKALSIAEAHGRLPDQGAAEKLLSMLKNPGL